MTDSSQPYHDLENTAINKVSVDINKKVDGVHKKRKDSSRSFGRQFDENSGAFYHQSPVKLQITTALPSSDKAGSRPHSLSSLSSLSASEASDLAFSPKSPAGMVQVVPSTTRPAGNDSTLCTATDSAVSSASSSTRKTYRSGQKSQEGGSISSKKHVQFEGDTSLLPLHNAAHSDLDDEEFNEDDFFDIIAEADRLMLNKVEEFAVKVDYNRLVLDRTAGAGAGAGVYSSAVDEIDQTSGHVEETAVCTAPNIISTESETNADVDNSSDLSLPTFPCDTSDDETESVSVTTSCSITTTDMSTQVSVTTSPEFIEGLCIKEETSEVPFVTQTCCDDEIARVSTDINNDASVDIKSSSSVDISLSASASAASSDGSSRDQDQQVTGISSVVVSYADSQPTCEKDDSRDCCESVPSSERLVRSYPSNLVSAEPSVVTVTVAAPTDPPPPSPSEFKKILDDCNVDAILTSHPSNLAHILRVLFSLAVMKPLTDSTVESKEEEVTQSADESVSTIALGLAPPPAVPVGRRQQGEWYLHTFRYLSRSWRGFF